MLFRSLKCGDVIALVPAPQFLWTTGPIYVHGATARAGALQLASDQNDKVLCFEAPPFYHVNTKKCTLKNILNKFHIFDMGTISNNGGPSRTTRNHLKENFDIYILYLEVKQLSRSKNKFNPTLTLGHP